MNLAAWMVSTGFDLELCGWLCLVLAHSLWQFALLAALATLIARTWKSITPEQTYALYAGALLLGLVTLPITFLLTRLPGEPLAMSEVVTVSQQVLSPQPNAPPAQELPVQQVAPPYMAGTLPEFPADALAFQAPPAETLLSWAPWLVGVYAVGVVVMLLRLLRGLWQNYRLSAQASLIAVGPLMESLQVLAHTWSLRVTPALALTEQVIVPQVVGLWRPTILLPAAALAGLRPDELEMILTHELAHVRRYDLWMNLVQRLAEAVLFFNPAVWYLSRRISTYREYCCDEATCRLARQSAGDTRIRYAEALLRAVELTQGAAQGQKLAALAATGNRPSELRRRVARLFGEPLREPVRITRSGLVTMLVGAAILLAIPLARQNAAETKEDTKQAESKKKPTVEVVAIGTHDEEPQRWWDAEGKPIDNVPFTWTAKARVTAPDSKWRRIVFRAMNLPPDADLTWDLTSVGASGSGEIDFVENPAEGKFFTEFFGLKENQKTFGLRVGIATGPWETITEANTQGASAVGLPGEKGIVFSQALSTSEGTVVVVSQTNINQHSRVVAIDKRGKLHIAKSRGGAGAVGMTQTSPTFPNLKPEDIDNFEFQTRDYEWTEIKNLPVEPQSPQAAVPAEAKPQVGVVAIGTHDPIPFGTEVPQQWWNAEGELLREVPFTWKAEPGGEITADKLWRRVVIHIDGQIKNSPEDRVWEVVGAKNFSGGTVEFADDSKTGTYLTRYYQLADGAKSFDLRVGIAHGPWQTVARQNSNSIIFSEPISTAQGVDVVVSHNVNDMAYRVVAVDKQGIIHESVRSGGIGGGGVSQTRGTFPGLTVDNVDHFEFQTREYEWVEFKDLPAEPGEKSGKVGNRPQRPESQTLVETAKIEAFKELVEAYESDYERVEALFRSGVAGGEPATKAQSQVRLALARADLAEAEDNPEERLEQLSIALVAAEEAIQALEHKYAAGTATLGELSAAKAERARIKMLLATAKEATKETERTNENVRSGASRPEIKDLPVEPGEATAETLQKYRRFLVSFGSDPESSLIATNSVRPEWLQHIERTGEIRAFKIRSKDRFLRSFETHFDAAAGYEDAFANVLEGLKRDPNGPHVDVRELVKEHLGDEVIIVEVPGDSVSVGHEHYLVCWSTYDAPKVDEVLSRFMQADPNAERTKIGDIPVWKLSDKGRDASGACVYGEYLIVATDFVLLEQVLSPGESETDREKVEAVEAGTAYSKHVLQVRPLLENLELAPSAYLNLWREATAGETAKSGRQTWTDTQTQTVWIRERSAQPNDGRHGHEAREFEFTDLPPGRYCVTAATYQRKVKVPDPTPFGVSRAVLLGVGEGTEKLEPLDVVMAGNRSLTVRVLDEQTGEPVEGMGVRLFNSRSVPIVHGHGSGNFFERTSEAGEVHFRNLPSDEYRIDILGRQARMNEFVEYKPFIDSLRIQLEGPKPQTVTYNAPPHRLPNEEVAKRFPFSVHGRVTDAGGKPLAGVEVRAATGHGTLLGGGRVRTDEQGKYRLHFGPGMLMMGDDTPHGVGVQAALFSASKPGWYDRDLNRGGDYLMSDSAPAVLQAQIDKEGRIWGHKSLDRIVFPNAPREVNFVLTPSATLRGKLTADPGNNLEDQSVYLTGDELPPGCSVLKQFETGEDGEFAITNLPVGHPWRFGIRVGGTWQEVETEPFMLAEPGTHECELILRADKSDAQVAVKLSYQAVNNKVSRKR